MGSVIAASMYELSQLAWCEMEALSLFLLLEGRQCTLCLALDGDCVPISEQAQWARFQHCKAI